jgi:hypothetical protein
MLGLALNAFFPLYEAPGELPQWGPLAVTSTAATALLLASVRGSWGQRT